MKVVLIIEQLDLSRGGAERSTFEFAERLADNDLSVTIVTGKTKLLPTKYKSAIINFDIKNRSRLTSLILFCKAAERLLRSEQFDIIHAITPIKSADIYQPRGGLIDETHRQNVMRRTGLSRLAKRIVGPNLRQRYIRNIERHLAANTDCKFLAVSDYVRRQCKEHLNLSDSRIKVIFNAVELERLNTDVSPDQRKTIRAKLNIAEGQLVGLFIANNFKLKGLSAIIDSLVYIQRNKPELSERLKILIAGTDKVRKWFNQIHRAGLENNILFVGPVQDVSRLYRISDFLIHPTWYDPCSRVALEAIAMGLPVITSKYNGAGELIRQADCGYIIDDMSNPEEIVRYVEKMADNNVRIKLSEKGKLVKNKIGIENHISQLIQFYHQCAERK